jgi:septal ring factor EnvC (AmiA/AmiB activator)
MMPTRTLVVCAVFAAIFFAGRPILSASPQDASEYEKRLSKIRQEIESLKGKIAAEEKKEKTVLSALDRVGLTKRLIRSEIALLSAELEKENSELEAIKKKIPALQADLDAEKEALARILVTLYKFGRPSFVRFLLQIPDLKTLLAERKSLTLLSAEEDRTISRFDQGLKELGRLQEALRAKEKETQELIRRKNEKNAELEGEEKKDRDLISQIRTNQKTFEQTLEELGFRAQELEQLLKKLEKQEPSLPFPLVPFYERKGRLPWPSSGKVIQLFGVQKGPFETVTMNNGIEIEPLQNDRIVRAVHAGKVVFADDFQGYGNLIILDHGLTYYSLYGHCSEFLVQMGDFVKTDQPIAIAGDTGSMVGISVYFEIRYKTKPLNPLQWLSRR